MMKRLVIVVALVGMFAVGGQAMALSSVQYQQDFQFYGPSWGGYSLPQFDSTLGTLQSVTLRLDAYVFGSLDVALDNAWLSQQPPGYSVNAYCIWGATVDLEYITGGINNFISVHPWAEAGSTLTTEQPSWYLDGYGPFDINGTTIDVGGSSDFELWDMGCYQMWYNWSTYGGYAPLMTADVYNEGVAGTLYVTYDYEANAPTAVPEPGTLALIMCGFLGLAGTAFRRMRRG
jgi:hypothetical protein